MMGMGRHGWFAVRISPEGGVHAELTGDHFRADESALASAVSGADGEASVAEGGSPVYLVRDSVVDVAARTARRGASPGLCDCIDGPGGEPCGECDKCATARRNAFTRSILGGLELPKGGLSDRLREAVSSAIGMTWADAPWSADMTEEEVDRLFGELKVKRKQ